MLGNLGVICLCVCFEVNLLHSTKGLICFFGISRIMESIVAHQKDLNFKATELRLGLPGSEDQESDQEILSKNNNKRTLPQSAHDEEDCESKSSSDHHVKTPPVAK